MIATVYTGMSLGVGVVGGLLILGLVTMWLAIKEYHTDEPDEVTSEDWGFDGIYQDD